MFDVIVLFDFAEFLFEGEAFLTAFLLRFDDIHQIAVEGVDPAFISGDLVLDDREVGFEFLPLTIGRHILETVDGGGHHGIVPIFDLAVSAVVVHVDVDVKEVGAADDFKAFDELGILTKDEGVEVFEASDQFTNLLPGAEMGEDSEI